MDCQRIEVSHVRCLDGFCQLSALEALQRLVGWGGGVVFVFWLFL